MVSYLLIGPLGVEMHGFHTLSHVSHGLHFFCVCFKWIILPAISLHANTTFSYLELADNNVVGDSS